MYTAFMKLWLVLRHSRSVIICVLIFHVVGWGWSIIHLLTDARIKAVPKNLDHYLNCKIFLGMLGLRGRNSISLQLQTCRREEAELSSWCIETNTFFFAKLKFLTLMNFSWFCGYDENYFGCENLCWYQKGELHAMRDCKFLKSGCVIKKRACVWIGRR